jgi:hypothetical protein
LLIVSLDSSKKIKNILTNPAVSRRERALDYTLNPWVSEPLERACFIWLNNETFGGANKSENLKEPVPRLCPAHKPHDTQIRDAFTHKPEIVCYQVRTSKTITPQNQCRIQQVSKGLEKILIMESTIAIEKMAAMFNQKVSHSSPSPKSTPMRTQRKAVNLVRLPHSKIQVLFPML